MAEYYELWKAAMIAKEEVSFFQEFFVKFYQAFIERDRWTQYLSGIGTTLLVTAIALGIGVVLGVLVAIVSCTVFKEKLTTLKFIAILTGVASIIFLNI